MQLTNKTFKSILYEHCHRNACLLKESFTQICCHCLLTLMSVQTVILPIKTKSI